MVNFTATPTWLEMIAWAAYLVPVLVLFLLPPRAAATPAPAPVSVGAPSSSSSTSDSSA
jgi:high-affinity iron transporter